MYPGAFVETTPDKVAYVMTTSGYSMTYRQLDDAANRLSQLFASLGLKPGDHVAICLENHDRYLEILWGARYAGLIYTACSSRLTSSELTYILNDCGAKAFITSAYKSDQAAEIVSGTPNVTTRLMLDGTIDGYGSYEDAVAGCSADPLPDRIAGFDMLYSSGTTGRPKGVLAAMPPTPLEASPGLASTVTTLFGVDGNTVYLSPAPQYHAAPLRFTMAMQQVGATAVVMEQFDPVEALRAIQTYRVTHSQWVPTMFVRMLKTEVALREAFDVSSLVCAIHAAAPCPIAVKRQMIQWWGPVLFEYYAGTEGNGFVFCTSEMWLAHEGTVGFPIACTVHIVGDDGEALPAYEPGTIYFEGGGKFEYHNDSAKTADSHNTAGWSTLGDVGFLDSDGFLFLTDRKAFMIISGGVNIYPQEAENVLINHPAVIDVAVFGVPNADFGEEVKAVVQPAVMPASEAEIAALAATLIAYCRAELADVKCPRSIDFRAELPRHPTGKLYKRLLKDEYWAGHGTSRII